MWVRHAIPQAFQLYRQSYTLYHCSGGSITTAINCHDQQQNWQKVEIHISASVSTSVWNSLFFYFYLPRLLSIRQDTTQEARFTTLFTDHKCVEGTLTVPPSESQPGHPVAARLRSLPLTVVALTERVRRCQGPLFAIYSLSPHEVRTERTLIRSSLLLAVLGLPWSCSVRRERKTSHPTRRLNPLGKQFAPNYAVPMNNWGIWFGRDWASPLFLVWTVAGSSTYMATDYIPL